MRSRTWWSLPWLWLLIAATGSSPAPDVGEGPAPILPPVQDQAPWVERMRPTQVPAEDSPPVSCYRNASHGRGDAYVCDLAVQVARDSGSPPALAAALNNRALVLAREGRLEPALEDLNAAVTHTPNDPALHGNLGNLLLRLGRSALALRAHDRAIELAPEEAAGYYNRAFSHLALGETALAQQDVAAARTLLRPRMPLKPAGIPALDDVRAR